MKKIYLSLLLFLGLVTIKAQPVPFWTENFGTGCNSGNLANGFNPGMGVWTTSNTGINDPFPNQWFISADEGGMGIGNCGDGCAGSNNNRTLHVGINGLDGGAIYLAGPGSTDTYVRVMSPVISCTGQINVVLTFAYLQEGVPGSDYFNVQYSANGGTTWSVISTPPQTNNGNCAPQGEWTGYTVTLPATANNNPNVKIGFNWQNNDANGADPGIAIDDVVLSATPNLPFSPTFTLPASICAGGSVNVTASTGTYVVTGYTWTSAPAAGIASPNASATAITFTNTGVHSVSLTATSGGTTATNVQTITVNAVPVLTVMASPASICGGQASTLSVSGANAYTWNPGAMTGSSLIVTPTVSTIYTVVGTTTAGCSATKTLAVTVGTSLSLTLTASPQTVCAGSSTTLTATGGVSYTWNPGAQSGSSIVSSPVSNTTYTASGANGSCTGSASIVVTVSNCATGIHAFALSNSNFKVFPNPANDKLYIQSQAENLNAEVIVIDALGKETSRQLHYFNSSACTVNVSALPKGIYFVKVASDAGVNVMRFVKE